MLSQAEHQHQQMMVNKGKRTKRTRPANSPLPPLITVSTSSSSTDIVGLCNSRSTLTTTTTTTQEEEDTAYCLILLAQGNTKYDQNCPSQHQHSGALIYECKKCNRSFPSFQALGGHRASHKKLKTEPEHQQSAETNKYTTIPGVGLACNSSNTLSAIKFSPNKLKVHACGFCGAEFSSGQALGGHMRRHRSLIAGGGSTAATMQSASSHEPPRSLHLCLDLNMPAEEEQEDPETPKFLFGSKDNTLVFTAGSLVDCYY